MENKKITVQERLDLMREKQKQIDNLTYERDLIEGDIAYQMCTVWSRDPAYNMICGVVPDFWDEIAGEYEKRKNDEKYLQDINWVLKIVKRKLKLPVETSSNFTFRYIEAMMFYGAGFGYKPCQAILTFELHYFGYKPIKIKIEIPIYENVNIKDYEYELDGIQIFYAEKDNVWMLACCDLEYEKLADKFQDWLNTELQNILEKEELEEK